MPAGVAFSEEVFQRILEQLALGMPLAKLLKQPGMPVYSSVMKWLSEDAALSDRYARAKEESADVLADEIMEIADEEVASDDNGHMDSAAVNRQRLRVDARKWVAAKLKPKKYGDKVTQDHQGNVRMFIDTGIPRIETPSPAADAS